MGGSDIPQLPRDRVYTELRQRLDTGVYPPGSRLPSMDELAREMDVSRGTIANALRRLQDEERVVILRGYGTYARLALKADREGRDSVEPA